MYMVPYPVAYDALRCPHRYKIPDFTKFSGQDNTSTVEHINRFIIKCRKVASQDALRVWLFSVPFWIGFCLVCIIASQFYYILGQFRKAIPSVLLLWDIQEEAFKSYKSRAEECWNCGSLYSPLSRCQEPLLQFDFVGSPFSWSRFPRSLTTHQREVWFTGVWEHQPDSHRLSGEGKSYEQRRKNFQKKINYTM